MAETEVSLSSDRVQRLLQCAICLDKFKQPKLLPCQHTFCLMPCLEGLIDHRTRSIRCPECRADHFVPRGGASHFPNNLTIIQFLSLSDTLYGPPEDNDNRLTDRHANQEGGNGEDDGDDDIENDDIGENGALPPREQEDDAPNAVARRQRHLAARFPREEGGCAVCRGGRILLRCCHCDYVLCDDCRQDHMEQARADLARLIEVVRSGLPLITDVIGAMTRKTTQLQSRCETVKSEISEAVEKHIRDLRARERSLFEDVDSFFSREIRGVRNCQENAEVEAASLSSFCDSAESVLGGRRPVPDGDVIEMKRQCEEHADTTRGYEDGSNRPPNVRQIQAALESSFLSSAINGFGELVITTGTHMLMTHTNLLRSFATSEEGTATGNDIPQRHPTSSRSSSSRVPVVPTAFESSSPDEDLLLLAPSDSGRERGLAPTRGRAARATSVSGRTTTQATTTGNPPSSLRTVLAVPEDVGQGRYGSSIPCGRSSSTSPMTHRRRRGTGAPSPRTPQVTFPDEDTSRWNALSQTMRSSNRRSRQDRLSDTRIMAATRGPTLTQQMRDRTRHLSLGLPMNEEEEEEDEEETEVEAEEEENEASEAGLEPWRETTSNNAQPISIRRRNRRSEPRGVLGVSHSYPGDTFGIDYLDSSDANFLESSASDDVVSPQSSNPFGSRTASMYVNTPRNGYNQKGTAVKRFGQKGSGNEQFIWPRGVAVSPLDDNIYVCDSSNNRVQIFDKTGKFIKWFGHYGQSQGEFDCLAGIAINGLGQVIIADRYNHRIQIFDRLGNFQKVFGSEGSGNGELNYPWGVACDNMGFIYICDKENHRIQVFQSNGSYVRSFGTYGNRSGQLENPHYVAVSPDNKVFVSDSSNHRIQVFSIYGDFLFTFGGAGSLRGQLKFPRGIAIDNQGFAVVADSGNNRIQVFRADGRYYSMFGGWGSENGQFKGLEGLAIQANGRVVVSDRENHRIQIF